MMDVSQYAIVNRDDVARTYSLMHGIFEDVAQDLFKDMDDNVQYTFFGRDNRKYTLTVKSVRNGTKDIKGAGE